MERRNAGQHPRRGFTARTRPLHTSPGRRGRVAGLCMTLRRLGSGRTHRASGGRCARPPRGGFVSRMGVRTAGHHQRQGLTTAEVAPAQR